MNRKICIPTLILFCFFLINSCKSVDNIRDNFADLSVKVNVAVEVKLILRTEEVIPDKFFIQDTHTYKLYEMTYDEKNKFYYEGLPAGNYRVGFWLAEHDTGEPIFKTMGYSDVIVRIPYERTSKVNVSLGYLRQQCNVSSLEVKPGTVTMSPKALTIRQLGNCQPLPAENITIKDLKQSIIFTHFGAGSAEYYDDNYVQLETRLNEAAYYEKEMTDKYLKVINKEYKQRGIDSAIQLINGYLAGRYSDHIVVKKAELLLNEGKMTECEEIFQKMYNNNPNFPEYFGLQGLKAIAEGKKETAQTMFYKAVSLGSCWAIIYDEFAKLVLEDENLKTAKLLSDYSLQIESNNIELLKTNLTISNRLSDNKRAAKLQEAINRLTKEQKNDEK